MEYQKIILRGQKNIQETKFIKRDFNVNLDDIFKLKKIFVLVGARRVGKTFMFYQIIDELLKQNKIKLENIVYINFSNIFFQKFNVEKLLEVYFFLYPDLKPVFFLDEIQELENFNKILLFLQLNNYQVFATGSNSKLLSKEISTNLRGKYLEKFIYPLSFKEFLKFKNFEEKDYILENKIGKIKNLFLEFLTRGAFPEVVLVENNVTKIDLLNSYFKGIIYIDLIERYKIENEKVLKELIESILKNIGKEFSVQKFFNNSKSKGIKIGKPTIYNYLQYLENIFFISGIKNIFKDQNQKFFLFDISFENILFENDNLGQRFENIIFIELKRRFENIYFKLKKDEIDFFIPEKNLNIQICYKLNEQNFAREIRPLLKQDGKKVLIYFEKIGDFEVEEIEIINFIDFFNF